MRDRIKLAAKDDPENPHPDERFRYCHIGCIVSALGRIIFLCRSLSQLFAAADYCHRARRSGGDAALGDRVSNWGSTPYRKKRLAVSARVGGLNNALPFSLIVWGQTQIDSGLASVLNATTPLFTVVVASVFLADERLTKNKLAGVMIGLVRICVLVGPNAFRGLGQSVLGQLAVVGAAMSYALAGVFSRRFAARGIPPLMIATGQVSSATLLLLIPVILIDGAAIMTPLPITAWGALIGIALFSTVLAYILYFRLIASAGATNAALVTFLIPLSAIALGAIFLGERFTPIQAAGAALIGVGLVVMDGRVFNRA